MEESWISWLEIPQQGQIYTPRTGHQVVIIGNIIYLFGGIDEEDKQNDLYMFQIEKLEWKKLNPKGDIPPARSGCQIAGFDTFFLLFGGYTRKNGDYFNDLYQYSLETSTWTMIKAKNPPPSRTDHIFVKLSANTCACFGGQNFISIMNDFYLYKITEKQWMQIISDQTNPGPTPRFGHSGSVIGSSIFIFGGWSGTKTLNDLWIYNTNTGRWIQQNKDERIKPRYRHSAVTYNKSIFVFGGVDKDSRRFDDLLEYNSQHSQWCLIDIKSGGPSARSFHRSLPYHNELFLIGGFDGQRKNDMYKLDLNLVQIESSFKVFGAIPSINGISEKVTKDQSYNEYIKIKEIFLAAKQQQLLTSGSLTEKQLSSSFKSITDIDQNQIQIEAYEVQRQKSQKNRWFYIKQKGTVFPPRTGHTAIFIHSAMAIYLFGGVDDNGEKNTDVYKFCILQNEWSIMQIKKEETKQSNSNNKINSNNNIIIPFIPKARSGCRAVEIEDSKIFYFGGNLENDKGYLQEILILNTKQQIWDILQPTNENDQDIPQGRSDHVMVKYFHNIYVQGGCGQGKRVFGDFYKYNLKSNKWKNIKCTQEEKYSRFGHSGVIFNHSIYIFGGWDGSDCLNDMHQFSIQTNLWYQVKDLGQRPAARYRHDAIMIQEKMYLFGGVDKLQKRFNDFFEFDLDNKTWTSISTTGCIPSSRTFHRLVKNENQIFLLGGYNGFRNNDVFTIFVQPSHSYSSNHINMEISSKRNSLVDFSFIEDFVQDEDKNIQKQDELTVISVLKNQVKELTMKLQNEEEKSVCKICFLHEINALFLDCCHLVSCYECSQNLKTCPVCRNSIVKVLKTYRN